MATPAFFGGRLLLAMPGIGDPRFDRAVIAICAHDDNGALGIGIGHVLHGIRFHDVLRQFDIAPGAAPDVAVHSGGPVEPQRGFVIHSADWGGQDSLHVAHDRVLTGTIDVLRAIAAGRGPKRWLTALGYAGWGPGQLDEEMTRHGWLLADADDAILYDCPVADRWHAAFERQGIDPAQLVAFQGQA